MEDPYTKTQPVMASLSGLSLSFGRPFFRDRGASAGVETKKCSRHFNVYPNLLQAIVFFFFHMFSFNVSENCHLPYLDFHTI